MTRPLRRLLAALPAAALLLAVAPAPAARALVTTDPAEAAGYGAGWLLDRLGDGGFVPKGDGTPDYSATVNVGLALAAAGVGEDAFDAVVDFMAAHVDEYVVVSGVDRPGALGRLAMLAAAAGEDPNSFGGSAAANQLVDRILATDTGAEPALFVDPAYPGLFNHALAVLGLATAESLTPAQEADADEAVQLLLDQQCPDGGWQNDLRAAAAGGGLAPCGTGFAGPDTNVTSLVSQALAAVGADADWTVDPLEWFDAAQNALGGFGYLPDGPTDANSTALAVQGILAAGGDPTSARFTGTGGSALAALLALQVGCAADAGDRGAWAYQANEDGSLDANGFATFDAVPAAAGATYPLDAAEFGADDATVPCAAPSVPTPAPTPTVPPLGRPAPGVGAGGTAAPAPVATLPATGPGADRRPWDTAGIAVVGAGLLGYGLIALFAARLTRPAGTAGTAGTAARARRR